jgi:hypothetical protein
MKLRGALLYIAVFLALMSLVATGLGGWIDMTNRPVIISREHAWNDGLYVILLAILLLMIADRV